MNRLLLPLLSLLPLVCVGACALVDPIEDGYELGQPSDGSGGTVGQGGVGGSGASGGNVGPGGGGMGGDPSTGGGGMGGSVTWSFGERLGADRGNVTSDTQVSQVSPNNNYGASISAWADDSGTERRVALLRFDLSAIVSGSVVEAAMLSIYTHDHAMANSNALIQLFEVLEAWEEGLQLGGSGTCNWNDRVANTAWLDAGVGEPGSRGMTAVGSYSPMAINTEYTVSLPLALVQGWVDDASSNHGVVFVNSDADGTSFKTGEHALVAERPLLTVTFSP